MKILDGTKTVFNEHLIDQVRKFLEEKIRRGEVAWTDAYERLLDETVPKLASGLNLTRQDRTGEIDRDLILSEIAIVKIFLAVLTLETKNIDRILGTHELLRKDNVRTVTDIQRRYLDIVNHSVQEFKTVNLEIRDGKIRLFPVLSQSFVIRDIDTTYQPESLVKRTGNDPTPQNVSPGTDEGLWETTVYTRGQEPVKAILTIDFIDTVSFNRVRFNSAGKFPVTISDVEILGPSGYQSIHVEDITSKYVNIIYPQSHQTSKVRITVEQRAGEFTWWTHVDNAREFLKTDTAEAALEVSTRESLQAREFIPVVEERLDNVYAYTLGAYNVIVFLDIYSGSQNGVFYSRKFASTEPIQTVELSQDLVEYKPGSSAITYSIIQQDGSRVAIAPGQRIALTKTFFKTQTLTNGKENWVELSSSPLSVGIDVLVNGEVVEQVTQFGGSGRMEYIISGRKLYFSVPIESKTVTVKYAHKTDFVIIEIVLNNGTEENQFDTPSVENFGVTLNGID